MKQHLIGCALLLIAGPGWAGEVDVLKANIRALGGGQFMLHATLQYSDTGWDHYANAWEVLGEDGTVLGTRVLHHPHVEEQPFTRSLTLFIPQTVKTVRIRAKDSVHGASNKMFAINVPH